VANVTAGNPRVIHACLRDRGKVTGRGTGRQVTTFARCGCRYVIRRLDHQRRYGQCAKTADRTVVTCRTTCRNTGMVHRPAGPELSGTCLASVVTGLASSCGWNMARCCRLAQH